MSKKWVYKYNRRAYGKDRPPVRWWNWVYGVGLLVVVLLVMMGT